MLAARSRIRSQVTVSGSLIRLVIGRAALLGALTVAFVAGALAEIAALPASASAVPIALDAPDNGSPPQVAFDPTTSTTYVAWSDPHGLGVDLCVVPPYSTACTGGAPVLLTDSKYTGDDIPTLGGLVVLPGGEAVVLGSPEAGDIGSVAWTSVPGGATFLSGGQGLQNNGNPISQVANFYQEVNAVALSSTDVGLLDNYGNFFDDTALNAASDIVPKAATNPGGQYPRQAIGANGPEIAAEAALPPAPAGTDIVVGVGSNNSSTQLTPPGCLNDAASGYGVSVGTVDGTSHTAGTLNSSGLLAYKLLACSAEAPVVASGGQDGIGVLDEEGSGVSGEGSGFTLDYRPFDATASGGAFGAPVELSDVTSEVLDGVDALNVVDDHATGVYAMWEDKQGTVLDYSGNGGASWGGPTVAPPPYGSDEEIAGVGDGVAVIAYDSNPGTGDQVFLEVVSYQALVAANTPPAKPLPSSPPAPAPALASLTIPKQTDDVTSKGDLSVVMDCSGARCSGNLILIEKVKKTTGKGKKKKTKTVAETIGSASFSSLALGTDTVTIKLNSKGLSLLKEDGYKLSGAGSATYLSGSVFKTATGDVTLKGHKPKPKSKK
jgi:hypothetical protein